MRSHSKNMSSTTPFSVWSAEINYCQDENIMQNKTDKSGDIFVFIGIGFSDKTTVCVKNTAYGWELILAYAKAHKIYYESAPT